MFLNDEQTCTKCGETKSLDAFYLDKSLKNGRRPDCKTCRCAVSKAWRVANPEHDKAIHRRKGLRKYNLTLERYNELLAAQDNKCAICGFNKQIGDRNLGVDHDHETGRVRGLLCHSCNVGIGHLGDGAEGVARALTYLQRTSGVDQRYAAAQKMEQRDIDSDRCASDVPGVRRRNLRRVCGTTPEQYDDLLAAQDGTCACCEADSPGRGENFFVDHDHNTVSVRGLLCYGCNLGIGLLGDSIESVQRALEYLKRSEIPAGAPPLPLDTVYALNG